MFIIYLSAITVLSIGMYFLSNSHRKFTEGVLYELNNYADNNDYDSIIELRKRYRRREYSFFILISAYILAITIPIGVFIRELIDSDFNIAIAITTAGLIIMGYIANSRKTTDRFRTDGQNPNNLNKGSFVIYLRAFNDDNTPWSSEEEIVRALNVKLPVYKIGKPNDLTLGEKDAIKFYETDDSWKEQISKAKEHSKFIVLSLNGTDGLIWEYLDTEKYRDKILYVVEKRENYTKFCIRYRQYTSRPFDASIPLQQNYPCFFWFNESGMEIHSVTSDLTTVKIVKKFLKQKYRK